MRWQGGSRDTALERAGNNLCPKTFRADESGVALRFPPQSKTLLMCGCVFRFGKLKWTATASGNRVSAVNRNYFKRDLSGKKIIWILFFGVFLIVVGYLSKNFILFQYDKARLANFAHKIADADNVIVTEYREKVYLKLMGSDAKKIFQAVSSAVSARMPNAEFAAKYSITATFFQGTNALGEIYLCEPLFILDWKQPPFYDVTGFLITNVGAPLGELRNEYYQTNSSR